MLTSHCSKLTEMALSGSSLSLGWDEAVDENRTRDTSLGSWSFTTKLRPQQQNVV